MSGYMTIGFIFAWAVIGLLVGDALGINDDADAAKAGVLVGMVTVGAGWLYLARRD